jgi:hypothetical protein
MSLLLLENIKYLHFYSGHVIPRTEKIMKMGVPSHSLKNDVKTLAILYLKLLAVMKLRHLTSSKFPKSRLQSYALNLPTVTAYVLTQFLPASALLLPHQQKSRSRRK